MNKAVFIDRDGTLMKDVRYCSKVEDIQLLPEVEELSRLADYKLIIITNQSGIARGLFTSGMLDDIHRKLRKELRKLGIEIDLVLYCPHHPDDNCLCRKPGTQLYQMAAEYYGLDLPSCIVVGDSYHDIDASKAIHAKSIQVLTGLDKTVCKADYVTGGMELAVDWILRR